MDDAETEDSKYKRRRHRRTSLMITYRCAVCGDQSNCYNFGVPACEGCKGFFRRHMTRIDSMVCAKDNNCYINIETRKNCSACRMRKCIENGMQRDPLTKDPVLKPRRRKYKTEGGGKRGRKPNALKLAARNAEVALTVRNSTDRTQQPNASSQKNGDSKQRVDAASTSGYSKPNTVNDTSRAPHRSGDSAAALSSSYPRPPSNATSVGASSQPTPGSIASMPPKKRKLAVDSVDAVSPSPSSNADLGSPNPVSQPHQRTFSDSSSKSFSFSESKSVQVPICTSTPGYFSTLNLRIGMKNALSQRVQQIAQSCYDQLSVRSDSGSSESARSAFRPFNRPTSTSAPASLLSSLENDFDCDTAHTLPNSVYDQILSNCVDFASAMCAPWSRQEVGAALYDNPHVTDACLQARFMETRIHRAVMALKKARCFSCLNNLERLALLKASLPRLMAPIQAFTTLETERSVIDRFDDGRTIKRPYSLVEFSFDQFGIDVREIIDRMVNLNLEVRCELLAGYWPIALAAFIIITICTPSRYVGPPSAMDPFGSADLLLYPSSNSDIGGETDAVRVARVTFNSKVESVHAEHLAFLYRFVHERSGSTVEANAAWRFSLSRIAELHDIGKRIMTSSMQFFALQPMMVNAILPVIDEVMGRVIGINADLNTVGMPQS